MGVFELPIVTNNKQKRLNESLQYKKYYIYKYLTSKRRTTLKNKNQVRQFKKPLKVFRKRYVQQFDRPQNAYEEWYPTDMIKNSGSDHESSTEEERERANDGDDVLAGNKFVDKDEIDLTFHKFNTWNHYSYIKDLKKKNKFLLLSSTKKQDLDAYDKTFLKKSRAHFKTKDFLTDYSEKNIILNNYKLLNISNIMQIWHVSVINKNWARAYKCMSIIVRIENIELKQIYSLIIVTLQNHRGTSEHEDSDEDVLLNFLKWVTFRNSPLVRVNLNRTQTEKFPFFNRIKTFNSIPNVIYFYLYYNILLHYKKFMETLSKKDITTFKQFLNSLEEMMLVPPFQDNFIFNYFLALSYMMLVDFKSILLESKYCENRQDILREINLNLNKSVKIFKSMGISTDFQHTNLMNEDSEKLASESGTNENDLSKKLYYYNREFISEQLAYLKNKIFGHGIDTEQLTNSNGSDSEESEYNNSRIDEEELMRQESLAFENLMGTSTQQTQQHEYNNQHWLD